MIPISATGDPAQGAGFSADQLIRSEERLHVATERVPAGWVRLEKYLVTETRTITVELTHEQVRLVRRGPDDDHLASAADPDPQRWMVLFEEQLVVTKKVVPVERVRLEIYPVTEQREVTAQVSREQIELLAPTASSTTTAPPPTTAPPTRTRNLT